MANVTMSIDSNLLAKARRLALEKRTSVNAMVRNFLEKATVEEGRKMEKEIRMFRSAVKKYSTKAGLATWTREELYER